MFFEKTPLDYPKIAKGELILYWFMALAGCLVLTCSAYYPAVRAYFVLDDYRWLGNIGFNEVKDSFFGSWGHGFAYRPLMRLSFWLDNYFFGSSPLGWHLHSYFLHAANAAWVFLIALKLFKDRGQAGLCAIFFTLAPWGHSNVAWISGRTYLLCGFFGLPALYFGLVLAAPQPEKHGKPGLALRFMLAALSLGLFTASLASYEAAVSLPAAFALCLAFLDGGFKVRRWPYWLGSLAWLAAFLWLRYLVLGNSVGGVNLYHESLLEALAINAGNLAELLFLHFRETLIFAGLLASGLVCLYVRGSRRIPLGAWLALAGFLALYAPFFRTVGVAPRYLYLADIALIFLCVAALKILSERDWLSRGLAGALVLALIFMSVQRCHALADEWKIAGNTAKNVLNNIRELYPGDSLRGFFVFHGVPGSYKNAGIFHVYFDIAVGIQYKDFRSLVYRTSYLIENPQAMPKHLPDGFYHLYDAASGKMQVISRERWLELYQAQLEASR